MQPYLFNFYWDGVGVAFSNETLQSQHALFNEGFTQLFPKLLYVNPFTTYNGNGIGFNSRLSGTAETMYSDPNVIKQGIIALAQGVDITGDVSKINIQVDDPNTQDYNIKPDPTNVNPLATTDGTKELLNSIGLPDNPIDAAKQSIMMLGLLAVGILIVVNKAKK